MANPTTNFGWVMPTSSSLVTNLPADFNTFGQAVDTSMSELLGGTTGQVLSKTSNTNMDFTWVTPTDQTPLTTKGDLFTFSTVDARLGVGTNGQTLVADSTAATGLKWATPASAGSGPAFRAFRNTTDQSIASTTNVKIQLNGETFDTDNCFDSTTNYRFTPTTAGYYLITANVAIISGGSLYATAFIYKNGSRVSAGRTLTWTTDAKNPQVTDIIYFNGSTDYIELYTLNNGATANVAQGSDETWLTGAFIHS